MILMIFPFKFVGFLCFPTSVGNTILTSLICSHGQWGIKKRISQVLKCKEKVKAKWDRVCQSKRI